MIAKSELNLRVAAGLDIRWLGERKYDPLHCCIPADDNDAMISPSCRIIVVELLFEYFKSKAGYLNIVL